MKFVLCILSVCVLAGFVFITGCGGIKDDISTNQDDISSNTAAIESCQQCHSATSDIGNKILGAQAGYESSGHLLGPRTYAEATIATNTGETFIFHGSDAMYCNGSPCLKCHTHQGFVEYVTTGTNASTVVPSASPPGCFTCHQPHENDDFTLSTTAAVTLVNGTTSFDQGDGNLCATCHMATGKVDDFVTGTFPKSIASYEGPHHGPQADFIMGVNYWDSGQTMAGVSVHSKKSATGPQDSCVTCHHYLSTSRQSGSLEMGGHGFYMSADVHGTEKDLGDVCLQCHTGEFTTDFSGHANDFEANSIPALDYDGDSVSENMLLEIKGLRDTLIGYFGNGIANFTGNGTGAIVDAATGAADATSGEWHKNWDFASSVDVTKVQAQSLWNFKYFMEDKSHGVHNPKFAAQILWDAIKNLNDNAGAGLTIGTSPH